MEQIIKITPKQGVNLLVVEVPENAVRIRVGSSGLDNDRYFDHGELWWHNGQKDYFKSNGTIELPDGLYNFIATTDVINWTQAMYLMDCKDWSHFKNYQNENEFFESSVDSLWSCIIAGGGEKTKRYAIIGILEENYYENNFRGTEADKLLI